MSAPYRWISLTNVFVFLSAIVSAEKFDDPSNEEGYGTEWMYFPDGDGIPQRISLHLPEPSLELRSLGAWWGADDDIQFRLYTKNNIDQYLILDKNAEPYNQSGLHLVENLARAPVVVVTHGWRSAADKDAVIGIKDAYLATQDVNVIAVDWSDYAGFVGYTTVAFQTNDIGKRVAEFLNHLEQRYGVSGSRVHLIGHSLGAHVMGVAGYWTQMKIGRITGLDPARPFFEWPIRDASVRLDATDADFVDIIHTCGGVLGVEDNHGHADFYPNSGAAPQPGCIYPNHIMEACSHGRAHKLYAESVLNPAGFPAYHCNTWSEYLNGQCSHNCMAFMGCGLSKNASGAYYLETNKAVPYARGIQ